MSKHIALIINKLGIGGAERVVQTLSTYFVEQGYKVTIITLHGGKLAYIIPDDVKMVKLASGFLAKSVGKIIFMWLLAAELAYKLKMLRVDHSLSFLVRANLIHVLSRNFGNKKPIHISERSILDEIYKNGGLTSRLMMQLVKRFYSKADSVIAISNGVKESLMNCGVSRENIFVIYNPQNLDDIKKKTKEEEKICIRRDKPLIVTSGRLVVLKDHYTLLDAFELVNRKLEAWLIIIGEGPEKEALIKHASKLGIEDKVIWTGWQKNPYAIMEKCTLFVLTSTFEGFGNVLVEAMACGLPVISTDCPTGPREILDNGTYGDLVPVGDSKTLSNKIIQRLEEPDKREDMKEKGYYRMKDFSVEIIAKSYISVIT